MERLTIDRFEGDVAVCEKEDGSMANVPRSSLPAGAQEGWCLTLDGGSYTVDRSATAARAARIAQKAMDASKD